MTEGRETAAHAIVLAATTTALLGLLLVTPVAATAVSSAGLREIPIPGGRTLVTAAISGDGRTITFGGLGTNPDRVAASDVFQHDLVAGATTTVSTDPATGRAPADDPTAADGEASADGTRVVFASSSEYGGPRNGCVDVFLHDRSIASTTLVSALPDGRALSGPQNAAGPSLSADGLVVAFGVVDVTAGTDAGLYIRDLQAGRTILLSRRSGSRGTPSSTESSDPSISGDGRVVVFTTRARGLVPGAPSAPAIFACDLRENRTGVVAASYRVTAKVGRARTLRRGSLAPGTRRTVTFAVPRSAAATTVTVTVRDRFGTGTRMQLVRRRS